MFGLAGGVAAAPLILAPAPASATPQPRQTPGQSGPGGPDRDGTADEISVHVGDEVTIVPPTKEQINQYPNSFAWDTLVDGVLARKVLIGVNRHIDDADAAPERAYFTSVDDGATWEEQTEIPSVVPRIQLRDGTVLGFGYYTYTEGDADSVDTGLTRTGVSWARSTDDGVSFTSGTGELVSERPIAVAEPAEDDASGVVRTKVSLHDRAFELSDGTICQPALVTFADAAKICSVLLATTDQGDHWTVRSVIAEDPTLITAPFSYEGLGEPNVVRLGDGSLLAVLRTGSWRPLYSCRSTDDGITWSAVEQIRAGDAAEHIPGINPKLRLLPNGLLVLMTGRDLIRLYISPDGRGEQWQEPIIISGDGFESGNGGLEVLAHNRVLVIGDKRSNNRPGSNPVRDYHIWSRVVTVNRHPLYRMDLAREIAAGTVTLTTDLDGQSGLDAAVALTDGFIEHGRRAVASGRRADGTVTIDLGRSVRLTQIGVGGAEHKQRFTVDTSIDGATWHQHHRGGHRGPQAALVAVDSDARWVRIQARASRQSVTLSEIEVHTAAMTFTDEPVGVLPYGFTGSDTAGVIEVDRGAVLRLSSDDDADPPSVRHSWGHGRAGVRVELDLRAVAIPRSAAVVQLLGLPTTGLGAEVLGVSVALRANGALQWWDGKVWNESHPSGTLTPTRWQRLVLTCPADRSAPPTLAIDGTTRELTYTTPLIWDFRALRFGLSSSASAGQEILIDNLSVEAM